MTDTVSQAAVNNIDSSFTGGGYLVTYIGVADFNAVSGSGAVALAYNGVAESQTEIEEGTYTLWGYAPTDYKGTLSPESN